MTLPNKMILFLYWFGTGIIMPVMSLMLLSRGCTLQTLSIAIGIYSVTVIALELPSGIFADLYGRKTAFLISCAANLISVMILLFAFDIRVTAAAMLFLGIGRAFSSGSIEALIIEQSMDKFGEECLARVTSSISVTQSIGIAAGALVGGLLPNYKNFSLHIAVRIIVMLIVGLLALLLMQEDICKDKPRMTLREHLTESKNLVMNHRTLRTILLCICVASIMLFTLETYWQPALKELIPGNSQMLLGVLCTLGFGATALGSTLMGRIKLDTQLRRWIAYLGLAAGMAICLFILSLQKVAIGFAVLYVLTYLFLGAINVPEQTIINAAVPNKMRAAMLSTASLSCQAGGVMSSLLCSMFIGAVGIPGIWHIAAALGIGIAIAVALREAIVKLLHREAVVKQS